MAKKGQGGQPIKLKSTASSYVYHTVKNKKKHPDRLRRRKFDPEVNQHVEFVEEK